MKKLKFAGIVFLISIMILSVLGSVVNTEVEAEVVGKSTSSELTPHEPIYIGGNDDFTEENGVVGGSGTESDPYIIEGWNIDASAADGIRIKNTDVYFIIRNCIIRDSYDPGSDTYRTGISFYLVQNGKIENVTSYNHYNGILLSSSSGNNITNCDFYDSAYGIYTYSSSNNNITSCCVYNNSPGIRLDYLSNNNQIANCYIYNNSDGIHLSASSNNTLSTNHIYENNNGIYFYAYSHNNQIAYCNITNNTNHGVHMRYYYPSNHSIFHHNNFIDNSVSAHDPFTNYWDEGNEGNYWDDYMGVDADSNGIGDTPYNISGGNNQDRYPLMKPVNVSAEINLLPSKVALNGESVTQNLVILAWSQCKDDDFAKYEIYQSSSPILLGTLLATINDSTTTTYNVTGLNPNTTYYFTIRVVDLGGLYRDSNKLEVRTLGLSEDAEILPEGPKPLDYIWLIIICGIIAAGIIIGVFLLRGRAAIPKPEIPPKPELIPPQIPTLTIRCPQCKSTFTVEKKEKPFKVKCPSCGKEGVIR